VAAVIRQNDEQIMEKNIKTGLACTV